MSASQRVQYCLLSLFAMAATAFCLSWWFSPERLNSAVAKPVSIFLFLLLTFVTMHRPFIEWYGWIVLRKVKPLIEPPPAKPGKRVALITTFVPKNESITMLERTLTAMVRADYPHDVWLLDEGDSKDANALCMRLGVRYFTRYGIAEYNTDGGRFAQKTKGGNHNACYDYWEKNRISYDVVAQFDSDFVVKRNVLTRTLGYFDDPEIGWVGTPQVYGNTEDSWVARGAAQQTYAFYGPVMRGLGDRNQGLLIGANHLILVQALRESGGYEGHLVEDLATGMKLGEKWKGIFVPEVLAVGEGPTTWAAYFKQQYRWACGGLDVLFSQAFATLWHRKLPLRQSLRYIWMLTFYLNGLAMGIGVTLLTLYYLTGITAANMPLEGLVVHYAPLLLIRQLLMLWSQRFNVRPDEESGMLWEGRFITMAALPVYLMAFFGVMRGKMPTFETTNKGEERKTSNTLVKPEGMGVFKYHVAITMILLSGLLLSGELGHTNVVFWLWGLATTGLMVAFSMVPSWVYRIRWTISYTWRMCISRLRPVHEAVPHVPVTPGVSLEEEPARSLYPLDSMTAGLPTMAPADCRLLVKKRNVRNVQFEFPMGLTDFVTLWLT